MDYSKLIADLKEDAEWAAANEWETPIMLEDHLKQAVEAIEELRLTAESYKRSMERWADEASNVLANYRRWCSD